MRTDFSKITKSPISSYDATVGIGGDYPNIGSAIADGKSNLLLISDIIQTESFTYPNEYVYINFNGYSLDMNIYSMTIPSTGEAFINLFNANISVGNTIGNAAFIMETQSPFHSTLNFIGKTEIYSNRNSVNIPFITGTVRDDINVYFDILIYHASNTYYDFIWTECPNLHINKLTLIGGGTDCRSCIYFGSFIHKELKIDIIEIQGIFSAVYTSLGGFYINNIYGNSEIIIGSARSYYTIPTSIQNINCPNATIVDPLNVKGESVKYIKGYDNGIKDYIKRDNVIIDIKDIENGIKISGNNANIKNCTIPNGTITINATADKTNISNCRTLTSIVDNGTNTILQNNQLI